MRAELGGIHYEDASVSWPISVVLLVGVLIGLWALYRVNRGAAKALAIALVATVILAIALDPVLSAVFG